MSLIAIGVAAVSVGATVGTSIYQSNQAADTARSLQKNAVQNFGGNPAANPLISAVGQQALLGLGYGDISQLGMGASPIQQVQNAIGNAGFNLGDQQTAQVWLNYLINGGDAAHVLMSGDQGAMMSVTRALQAAGYGSVGEFQAAQKNFVTQQATLQAQLAPIQAENLQARNAAYGGIAKIAQNFPQATAQNIQQTSDAYANVLKQQNQMTYQDILKQQQQAANAGGYNPGAILGRVAQQQALDLNAIPLAAMQFAQQSIGGQQQLAANSLNAYQGILNPGTNLALQAAGLQTNANLNASQIAAQQAASFNQNQSNIGLTGLQLQNQAVGQIGQGISSAGTDFALLRLLQQQRQVGGGGPGINPGATTPTFGNAP